MFAGFRRLLTVPGDDGFDTKSLCVYKQGESVSSEEGRETKAQALSESTLTLRLA